MTDLERLSIKRTDLPDGGIDYEIQLRSARSGFCNRIRFQMRQDKNFTLEVVAVSMALAIAGAMKHGYDAGLLAARWSPEILLDHNTERLLDAPRNAEYLKTYLERHRAQDDAEGFREVVPHATATGVYIFADEKT